MLRCQAAYIYIFYFYIDQLLRPKDQENAFMRPPPPNLKCFDLLGYVATYYIVLTFFQFLRKCNPFWIHVMKYSFFDITKKLVSAPHWILWLLQRDNSFEFINIFLFKIYGFPFQSSSSRHFLWPFIHVIYRKCNNELINYKK